MIAQADLLDRGNLMLLMAILPMMLIGTIVVVSELDARGLLGPPRRIPLHVPLCVVAAGLSLAGAAVHVSQVSQVFSSSAGDDNGSFLLAVIGFQVGWSVLHLRTRGSASATLGMAGTGIIIAAWLAIELAAAGVADAAIPLSELFAVGFEVALILALVPQVAPLLAARLAERRMKVQRATVLSAFCLAVTALFTSLALVG